MGSPFDPSKAAAPLPRKGADDANARRLERREQREEDFKKGGRKKGPVLLVLLLVAAVVVGGVVLLTSGDDAPTRAEREQRARQLAAQRAEDALVMGSASLRAGDTPIIPPPDVVERLVGRRVTGEGVSVVDVTERGFFVTIGGTQETQGIGEAAGPAGRIDRVYVASSDRPQRGARIDLQGRVRDVPARAAQRLGLDAATADIVRSAGFYVEGRQATG